MSSILLSRIEFLIYLFRKWSSSFFQFICFSTCFFSLPFVSICFYFASVSTRFYLFTSRSYPFIFVYQSLLLFFCPFYVLVLASLHMLSEKPSILFSVNIEGPALDCSKLFLAILIHVGLLKGCLDKTKECNPKNLSKFI